MDRLQRNTLIVLCAVSVLAIALVFNPSRFPPSLAGLIPSGEDQGASEANANLEHRPLRIVAAGNWDCTNETAMTVAGMKSRSPDFVLGLGGYSYGKTADCWADIIKPLSLEKIKIAIGEIDREPVSLREQYLTELGLPGEYYSFNAGQAHFLALSTEIPEQVAGSPQYRFAEKDLASASSDPAIRWIIVYFNRPMYTSQPLAAFSLFREIYHPLFEKNGVDIVLQGRDGNYQRTLPLSFNDKAPQTPLVEGTTGQRNDTSSTGGSDSFGYTNPEGIIFLTVGTAGREPINTLSSKPSFVAFQYDLAHGFLELDISPPESGSGSGDGSSMLTGQFYANSQNINDESPQVVDSFSVTKR